MSDTNDWLRLSDFDLNGLDQDNASEWSLDSETRAELERATEGLSSPVPAMNPIAVLPDRPSPLFTHDSMVDQSRREAVFSGVLPSNGGVVEAVSEPFVPAAPEPSAVAGFAPVMTHGVQLGYHLPPAVSFPQYMPFYGSPTCFGFLPAPFFYSSALPPLPWAPLVYSYPQLPSLNAPQYGWRFLPGIGCPPNTESLSMPRPGTPIPPDAVPVARADEGKKRPRSAFFQPASNKQGAERSLGSSTEDYSAPLPFKKPK